MAVRIRKDGVIVCAAMHPEMEGDTYIDDQQHYDLAVIKEILITDKNHLKHGYWWWKDNTASR
jgi:hypothetical protein